MDTDAELIERCRSGDLRAYQPLVQRHEDRIYNLARGMLGTGESARDATQEAFIRAWRSLPRFKGDATFYTWLYRIAVNVCLNAARKDARRLDRVPLDDAVTAGEIPPGALFDTAHEASDFERAELRARVHALLGRLSPEHRAVLVLKDIEDRTQEEIAALLGCSVGTVKSRLARARVRMKALLQPLYDEWSGKDPR